MLKNKNLLIIALIAVVNALGYGIIIPILYSYSIKFGLSDFDNGLLFSLFSICQFASTPLIGRLSDKYGRKPLLIISLAGTALSFFMTAFAPNVAILFLARALDGITAGNIPVASAVISDTTEPKDRAKGFGIIGASFGFGFIFGPAISAVTVGFGDAIPFIIAGVISLVAVILTWIILPETNKHLGEVKHWKLFDFPKLIHAATDENVGATLLITLVYSFAFGMLIYAFQPFSVKVLHLSANGISALFTLFGIVGLITQILLLPKITKKLGDKNTFKFSLVLLSLAFFGMFLITNLVLFILLSVLFGFANSFINPLIQTILSKETDEKSQGSMMGINASYMSIGTILGPIAGGAVATLGLAYPYFAGGISIAVCFILTSQILKRGVKKESAF